jgi:hypothetical protein
MEKRQTNDYFLHVNSLKFKAWTWWRSLSSDMRYTIINNPQVNIHYNDDDREKTHSLQPFIIEQLFIKWLTWDIEGGCDNE